MEIILHSLDDVRDLVAVLNPDLIINAHPGLAAQLAEPPTVGLTGTANLRTGVLTLDEPLSAGRAVDGAALPVQVGTIVSSTELAEPDIEDGVNHATDEPVDADGVPHNTDWHSDPPKINAGTGLWKARRKRDEDAYQAWLTKCREDDAAAADAAASAEPAGSDDAGDADTDEPLATETHALPQDEAQPETPVRDEPAGPDLAALIAASQEAAEKAPSDLVGLLDASKLFISAYSTATFHALKSAVAPIEGTSSGKAMQTLTPEERQLLRACMDNYPLYV